MSRTASIKKDVSAQKQAEQLIKESKMLLSAEKLLNKITASEVKHNIAESRKLFALQNLLKRVPKKTEVL